MNIIIIILITDVTNFNNNFEKYIYDVSLFSLLSTLSSIGYHFYVWLTTNSTVTQLFSPWSTSQSLLASLIILYQ